MTSWTESSQTTRSCPPSQIFMGDCRGRKRRTRRWLYTFLRWIRFDSPNCTTQNLTGYRSIRTTPKTEGSISSRRRTTRRRRVSLSGLPPRYVRMPRVCSTGLSVSMQEATLLFDEWDTDGSGTISFQELKKCLKKKRKPTEPARRVRHGGVRLKPIPQGSTDGVGDAAAPAAPAAAAPAAAAPPPESAHLLEPEREPEPEPEAQPPE